MKQLSGQENKVVLEDWINEIRDGVVALGKDAWTVGVDSAPAMAFAPALGRLPLPVGRAGFPGVLPLWSDGRHYLTGLLAGPRPFDEWPGVFIDDGQGITIASDRRTLLPQLIVVRILSNVPDMGRELAERWDGVRERVESLHRVLGGEPDSLEAVVAAACTVETRRSLMYRKDRAAEFQAAHSSLFRRVDRSGAFTRYADWLDAALANQWLPVEEPAQYGPWARRTIGSAQQFPTSRSGVRREWIDWYLLGVAGIDSALSRKPTWHLGGASGETTLVEAAERRTYTPGPAQESEEVSDGLVAGLLKQGSGYTGLAHAEAAVVLDESGQSEHAWEALQSAAWWSVRNMGSTPDSILDSMQFLAERHGWTDIAWVLQRAISG